MTTIATRKGSMRRPFLLPEWLTVRQSAPALTKNNIYLKFKTCNLFLESGL
jgi:hypothetical protein